MSLLTALFGNNQVSQQTRSQLEGPIRGLLDTYITQVQTAANEPYTPYPHARIAPLTDSQLRAYYTAQNVADRTDANINSVNQVARDFISQNRQNILNNVTQLANNSQSLATGSGGRIPISDALADTARNLAGLSPGIFNQAYSATMPLTARFPDVPIADYMNPYLEQVLEPALRDLERQAERNRLALNDRSAQTASFGGSRNAIAQQMQEQRALEEYGRLSANERARAFNEAANQWRLDQRSIPELYSGLLRQIGAAQGTQQLAQQMNSQAIQDRANVIQQNLAAQQAQRNATAAAGDFVNLAGANQALNMTAIPGGINPLTITGGMLQQHEQSHLDRAYQDFLEQRDWPLRGVGLLGQAFNLTAPTTRTTETVSTGPTPNRIGQTIGALTGLIGAFGGIGGGGLGGLINSGIKSAGRLFGLFSRGGLVQS